MEPIALFVFGACVVLGIAFLAWYFGPDQSTRRAMRAVPRRAIGEVQPGEKVRVVGEVQAGPTVAAPLSGRACTYWRVMVQEQRSRGKNRHWVTVVDEHAGVDFVVRDGSAKALVKTELVTAVLEQDGKYSSGFLHDATPELEAFLADRGLTSQGFLFNKGMRYREGVVEVGEEVGVVGVGRWEQDPDEQAGPGPGYRDARLPMRLVLESPADGPLLLSDEPAMRS